MKIAVIPARGGSKRIPRKNIKEFYGKPAIAWSILAAKTSGLFDRIIVSTEDNEIAEVARYWGAETPFVRPKGISEDLTPTVPVIAHAINTCVALGWDIDFVCCIYPCAPFINVSDLAKAFDLLISKDADFVYPITEYPHPIQRCMRQLANGKMKFLAPEFELTRTQDLEKLFHDAGQFYWGKSISWLNQKKMHTDGVGMPIPSWRVVDIDSLDDWLKAEILFDSISRQASK